MAVAFDASGEGATFGGTVLDTTALTIGSGSQRALGVGLAFSNNPGTVTAHWDSAGTNQLLTLIPNTTVTSGATTNLQCWGLLAPTSGNKNLHVTTTNSVDIEAHLLSVTGASQTSFATTFINGNTNTGNSAGPTSVVITSATGDIGFSIGVNAIPGFTGTVSPGTLIAFDNGASSENSASQWFSGAASITATETMGGGTDNWAASGFDISATGGGGGTVKQSLVEISQAIRRASYW